MSAFKKLAFHSMLCAVLAAPVSAFVVPSAFSPKTIASVGENGFCKAPNADEGRFCSSSLKAVRDDQDLDVFVHDMLTMSNFVYEFNST